MSKNIRLRQPGIVRKDVFEAERGQYLHYEMMFTFSAWTSDAFLIFALFFADALCLYYCYTSVVNPVVQNKKKIIINHATFKAAVFVLSPWR